MSAGFRKKQGNISRIWKKLGPGLVTGVSDDDPSGIATYSQAGAQFGLSLLWTALLTYPLMFAIQSMCARIGIISSSGLVVVMKKHYSKSILYFMLMLIIPAVTLNISANLAGMSAVSNLLFPQVPSIVFDFMLSFGLFMGLVFFSYQKIASILKYLTFAFVAYFIVPFLIGTDWKAVLENTFIPNIQLSKEFIAMLTAVLGTTISPYLFFWQSSMSVESFAHNSDSQRTEIKNMGFDVNIGMLISNLVMFFIILTTATTLFQNGIKNIETVEQAALALKPIAGDLAYVIFSLGVLGSGFIATPVLAACIGYICGELFNWKVGLDKKLKEAPEFYGIIFVSLSIGFLLNLFDIDPIKSLVLTAIVYGVTAPVFIAMILHICNNAKIMGRHTNTILLNILGIFTFILMTVVSLFMLYALFLDISANV